MRAEHNIAAQLPETHVSVTEHERAKSNFDAKFNELERIVKDKKWGEYPDDGYLVDFCNWEDETKGLKKVARSILYDTLIDEREKVQTLLKQFRAGRRKRVVQTDEVTQLQQQLDKSLKKAQSYVNQYVAISIEVTNLREKVKSLTEDNALLAAKINKVSPIRGVAAKGTGKENRP
ncbi:hypothetical protein LZ009_09295 [Ramlibacter sp. XY19]|uniref:hypothetical protein n=1 Tax=Ramlibacter paludis TaxID=2908000 RepID=UPI0023DC9607|nr:hypothetical protein [Ramlibacter paludis]MCG2592974.1 hypothetical protein [Ramlibacter paludis]